MDRLVRWIMIALCAGVLPACSEGEVAELPSTSESAPIRRSAPAGPGGNGFVVGQTPLDDPADRGWEVFVRENQLLEGYAGVLNGWISVPEEVALTFASCGEANAFFDAEERAVVMCYELLATFAEIFGNLPGPQRDEALLGATDFIFYHEVGHALIDVLDLPALGREEDVADQLAVYILTDGSAEGEQAAIDGAVALYRLGPHNDEVAYADEHSLGAQRFYNIACWVYGQNPERYATLVQDGVLPEARAERCPDEYTQLHRGWSRLLRPNLKS